MGGEMPNTGETCGSETMLEGQSCCTGHCGINGDEQCNQEPTLNWCCTSCNCKDLNDKETCGSSSTDENKNEGEMPKTACDDLDETACTNMDGCVMKQGTCVADMTKDETKPEGSGSEM